MGNDRKSESILVLSLFLIFPIVIFYIFAIFDSRAWVRKKRRPEQLSRYSWDCLRMETGFSMIGLSMTGPSMLFCPISREEVVDFAEGYEISDFLSLADKHFNGCFFQSQYFHFIISNERRGEVPTRSSWRRSRSGASRRSSTSPRPGTRPRCGAHKDTNE